MRDLMELATSEPPPLRCTVDEIVEAGQRVERRRRLGWVTSGAAAVVALGVAATVAVPSLLGGAARPTVAGPAGPVDQVASPAGQAAGPAGQVARPAADAARPVPATPQPFTFTFDGYQVGRLRVAKPIDVSTAYQLASVYADGLTTNDKAVEETGADESTAGEREPWAPGGVARREPTLYAYLAVYRRGAYDPTKLVGARPVTVAGRPGLETNDPTGFWAAKRILAWQYAPNAWAVINSSSTEADYPSAADLRQLAAGLRAAVPVAAKVPLRMSYLPSGYHLDEVAMHAMAGLNGIASARDGDYAGLRFSKPAQPTTGLTEPFGGVEGADPPGSFQIFVVPAKNSNQQPSPGVSCGQGFCNRWVDGDTVGLQVSSGGRLPNSEMRKILDGIRIGNVHDDGTWTEVRSAIG